MLLGRSKNEVVLICGFATRSPPTFLAYESYSTATRLSCMVVDHSKISRLSQPRCEWIWRLSGASHALTIPLVNVMYFAPPADCLLRVAKAQSRWYLLPIALVG